MCIFQVVRLHQKRCFKATYSTNSVGARDVERSPAAARPRAVVLGDSFLEGWGLPAAERLSNLLEESTGVEHLNFAMSLFRRPWWTRKRQSHLGTRLFAANEGVCQALGVRFWWVLGAQDCSGVDRAAAGSLPSGWPSLFWSG